MIKLSENEILKVFGQQLDRLMKENKITDTQLAKSLGVNRSSVNRWRNGVITPNLNTLPEIAKYFDVPTSTFITPLDNNDSLYSTIKKLEPKYLEDLKKYADYLLNTQLEENSNNEKPTDISQNMD